ncbi:hypothetical protein EF888_10200 [Silicimonas algicola]|uniref:Uncharacterized protein n=1 Tax=Silicimonas algicola TaxID=1826607 RepID=A0A316GBZ0_9RHOB|nr:hypothetical protein [Silicimonas algicola]AZQ67470.1 hypothetical protein EF888_10200 [Silicimonas algicola]PWK57160.1 hypothetical protein C8D95_103399 [Silicimonas algicola]
MAERIRSKDGKSETDEFVEDIDTPSQQGRGQGNLERKVGTRDELRQPKEGDVRTRVHKSDEEGEGDLGGLHGTGENDERS